jgi:4-amino-4-deoxy-L-arabinose transferase-like glycosyltransferase
MQKLSKILHRLKAYRGWPSVLVTSTILLVTFLLYQNLGRDPLFNWDEGIYAELGRSLIVGEGNLLTPSWNGDLWLEKPPLIAWLTGLGLSIFGVNEFGARSLMPLFAVLTLVFVYKIGVKLGGFRLGYIAMTLLATFDLFLARSRAVNTDGVLLAAMAATIYAALNLSSAWVIALGISFAVFAKGSAGLLVAILVFPLIFKRGLKYLMLSTFYFLLFTLPWHLYQLLVHKELFYTPYFLEQVVRRVTVPIEFHLQSRWYYFQFLAENLQGGVLYLLILALIVIGYQTYRTRKLQNIHFLIYWLFVPLVIFTFAKTRLYWYILPIYPAIALLIAYVFSQFQRSKLEKRMLLILILGLFGQSLLTVARSVEITRRFAPKEGAVKLAELTQDYPSQNFSILVPKSERDAEAILPTQQRISSSFRYGGAPNLVFYSQKQVHYFYNIDDWRDALDKDQTLTLLHVNDLTLLPKGYVVETLEDDYALAIRSPDASN